MRLSHLEAFRPICLHCRKSDASEPLRLENTEAEADGWIRWGILRCGSCGMEYPIVDGMPVLVPDVRAYVGRMLDQIAMRSDIPATIESLLGDAAGPGSAFDAMRQTLSGYAWDHYADLDPAEGNEGAAPGAAISCLEAGLAMLPSAPVRSCLDLGCGPGRTSFLLASACDGLVLGIDLNPSLLRLATAVLRERRVRYPRRRIGLVYDRRDFPIDLPGAERVDFWIADATALPLADGGCDLAVALNVLDCLGAPAEGLAAIGRALRADGRAILASPYDWSTTATPVENWIGGHSQRGPHKGAAEPLLRRLLNGESGFDIGLELLDEKSRQPWQLRLHDRSIMRYDSHLVVARRRPQA